MEFDRKRQGWHDRLTGTYVVDVDEHFADSSSVRLEPADSGKGGVGFLVWDVVATIALTALLASRWVLGLICSSIIRGVLGD